ncbi:MAG: cobalamin biosynthesis protein [Sulfuricella sp.]|nr:cobalamin biosynthesis protein [Sulfuricella sp.]
MLTALILAAALLLDTLLGETRRWHPLVGFGKLACRLEGRLYGPTRQRGAAAVFCLLVAPVGLAAWLAALPGIGEWLAALLLYFAIGQRSLGEHAQRVQNALQSSDLELARRQVGMLVSRDTAAMQAPDVARAAVESVLENGNDAVFGAIFWFLVAGAPGALLYRLANTLDAMWGYKNARYRHFGWAAARLDDALNYLPARLTALTYAVLGQAGQALACWRVQAPHWDSPNAGPVMAAGAGSLGVALGGPAVYHGTLEQRPVLGAGGAATARDIGRALTLVRRGVWLWLALTLIGGLAHA